MSTGVRVVDVGMARESPCDLNEVRGVPEFEAGRPKPAYCK